MIDVKPTAEAIKKASKYVIESGNRLEIIAAKMIAENDISYAAEAAAEIIQILQSARLDLLITRPIRELDKIQRKSGE